MLIYSRYVGIANIAMPPEAFKPERFKQSSIDYKGTHFDFTPFGVGRWQRPGMLFGTSTVEIALAILLYHFDWVNPGGPNQGSLDMSQKFGINVRRKIYTQLRATPYVHSNVSQISGHVDTWKNWLAHRLPPLAALSALSTNLLLVALILFFVICSFFGPPLVKINVGYLSPGQVNI